MKDGQGVWALNARVHTSLQFSVFRFCMFLLLPLCVWFARLVHQVQEDLRRLQARVHILEGRPADSKVSLLRMPLLFDYCTPLRPVDPGCRSQVVLCRCL